MTNAQLAVMLYQIAGRIHSAGYDMSNALDAADMAAIRASYEKLRSLRVQLYEHALILERTST